MSRIRNPQMDLVFLNLKQIATSGGEKGPFYDKGVLSVIRQIEEKGVFDADPLSVLLRMAYFDQVMRANIMTQQERVQAADALQGLGWTLEQGKEYAAGVGDAQRLLMAYANREGDQ